MPPPKRSSRALMVSLIVAGVAVAVLATLVFVGAGRLSDAQAETAIAEEKAAAQDQEIAGLSEDVASAEDEVAAAEDATEQAQQEAEDAQGQAGAAQGTIAALAQCAAGMMAAVNAVAGTIGTGNWTRFYSQRSRTLPYCSDAVDLSQTRRRACSEKNEAVWHGRDRSGPRGFPGACGAVAQAGEVAQARLAAGDGSCMERQADRAVDPK
jgi:hypothetical protein